MKSNRVMLRVEDFRAIGKAEIKLDGITVVAGVNGCGKSTLSKLLYTAFNLSINFKKFMIRIINKEMEIFSNILNNFIQSLSFENPELALIKLQKWLNFYEKFEDDKSFSKLDSLLFEIKNIISSQEYINNDVFMNEKIKRFWDLCFQNLANHAELKLHLERIKNTNNWIDIIDFMIFYSQFTRYKYLSDAINQPSGYLYSEIKNIFHVNTLPKIFEIWEKDVPLIFSNSENMMTPFEIDNVIYIDTPMFFGHTEEEHWKDANEKLKQRPKLNEKPKPIQEIDDLIKRQIFRNGAEVKFDELSESFTFRTSSGVEMDLSDSATGMKTFAVLDRLVKNGSINKKTLLILDEPEAHLHPQWIVELGRLLTLINKHIGAKIFVATHSPDMVQALRYIPNKEGTGDNVNFYLAEFNQENGLFDYKDLNGKVGEIFTSFNKSLDKLEKYGE